jgi:hypothetical protein
MPVAAHHVEVELRRANDEMVVKVIGVRHGFEKSGPLSSATSVLLRSRCVPTLLPLARRAGWPRCDAGRFRVVFDTYDQQSDPGREGQHFRCWDKVSRWP